MHADSLDTIWAATRPEEPSADAFDAMWTEVTARASEPEILPMPRFSGWKPWALGAAMLAQAAGLLIAAGYALAPPKAIEVAKAVPTSVASPSEVRVDAGYTVYVSIDDQGGVKAVVSRPEAAESETDIRTAEGDIFNFMESYQ